MDSGPSKGARSFPLIADFGVLAMAVIIAAGFLAWYFGFRDTWEADNAFKIKALSADVFALNDSGRADEAIEVGARLHSIVSQRKIEDPELASLCARALGEVDDLRRAIERERQAQTDQARENETLVKVNRLVVEAAFKAQSGDPSGAMTDYDTALNIIASNGTTTTAFVDVKAKIGSARLELTRVIADRQKETDAAEAAAAETKRLAALRAIIRGGAWVTRPAGNSDPLRGLDIFFVPQHVLVADTIAFMQARFEGERVRLRSANVLFEDAKKWLEESEKDAADFPSLASYAERAKEAVQRASEQVARCVEEVSRAEDALNAARAAGAGASANLAVCYYKALPAGRTADEWSEWCALVAKQAVRSPHTDVDGKYETVVPGGRYFVYASVETEYAAISWFLPLDIQAEGELIVDLRNENATDIWNKPR